MSSPSGFAELTVDVLGDEVLGSGGSGLVWRATMKRAGKSDTLVALKISHACKSVVNPPLRHEACALLALRVGHSSIPEVYAWGRSNQHEYLAMQLLGAQNMAQRAFEGPAFTVGELAALTCTMLDAVEHVHSCNLIHGDIKPQNFVFSLPPESHLYLIDYGLTTWHSDPDTRIPFTKSFTSNILGTRWYCSINTHLHQDDMELLAYTVISLLRGSLPWQTKAIFLSKQRWSGDDLGFGYPRVFGDFVSYARALRFESEPEYARWKGNFQSLLTSRDAGVVVGTSCKDTPDPKPSLQVLSEPLESSPVFTTPDEDDYFPVATAIYPRIPYKASTLFGASFYVNSGTGRSG